MKNYTIYIHINKTNNKCYVGQTKKKPSYRWGNGNGYSRQSKFYNSIVKYGWDNFHHIVICETSEDRVDELESYYIGLFDCVNNGYNLTSGGNRNKTISDETRCKMSEAGKARTDDVNRFVKGQVAWNKGLKASPETLERLRISHIGQKQSSESIAKRSKSVIGINIETGEIIEYPSMREAERNGYQKSSVARCISGKYKQAYGYIWKYKKESVGG